MQSQSSDLFAENDSASENQIAHLVAGVTGLIKKPIENSVYAAGNFLHGALQGRAWQSLAESWNYLESQGKISKDYLDDISGQLSLQEILRALNEEYIDEGRVEALKRVFLNSAIDYRQGEVDGAVIVEIMKIISRLTTAQIMILSSCYKLSKEQDDLQYDTSTATWLRLIAKRSGLRFESLVENEETQLIEMRLLTDRQYSDRSGVILSRSYRLTDFAQNICKYMEEED